MRKSRIIFLLCIFSITINLNAKLKDHFNHYDVKIKSFGQYDLKNKSFYILSGDEYISNNDIEFKEYASWVSYALKLNGAIEVEEYAEADITVLLSYDITDKSYTEKIPRPIYGATGINSVTTKYTQNYDGSITASSSVGYRYGVTGVYYQENEINKFLRILNIYVYDNKERNNGMVAKLNVSSMGSTNNLRTVFPALAYAAGIFIGNIGDYKTSVYYKIDEKYQQFIQKCLLKYGQFSYTPQWSLNKKIRNLKDQHIYACFQHEESTSLLLYAHERRGISIWCALTLGCCLPIVWFDGVDYRREFEKKDGMIKYFLLVDGKKYPISNAVYNTQYLHLKFDVDTRNAHKIQLIKVNKKGKLKDYWEVINL